ncbi:protein ripply1-like [Ambystoma mexicanum]|uniref:protein ripply1-like n=1 Tax=Ambystoma mexicanum TaxID=8296 RepID=UPI0037E78806
MALDKNTEIRDFMPSALNLGLTCNKLDKLPKYLERFPSRPHHNKFLKLRLNIYKTKEMMWKVICFSYSSRSEEFWRPWLVGRRDLEQGQARIRQRLPYGAPAGKHGSYKHPVRLFWPNSRSSDHLYVAGEALLSNFPVQATIAFYEESDSESDAGSSDESCDSGIESE